MKRDGGKMPNKQYARGFRAEDRCLQDLLRQGWWAERAHASKNTFDIIAVREITRFIQVKRSKMNIAKDKTFQMKYKVDIKKMSTIPVGEHVSRELWIWIDAQWVTNRTQKTLTKGGKKERKWSPAHWRKFRILGTQEIRLYEIKREEIR
jgi:hypothetical protein